MANDHDLVDRMRNHFLEPEPDEKPVTHCEYCGADLYDGDDYYYLMGDIVCPDCVDSMKRQVSRYDFED